MINAWWLLPAFMAGGFMGVGVMCLMFISREGDDAIRQFSSDDETS